MALFFLFGKVLARSDYTSKSMHKMLNMGESRGRPLSLSQKGRMLKSQGTVPNGRRLLQREIVKKWEARSKEVSLANGEVVPTEAQKVLHDTLTVPDLASVEASFERTQLLVQQGQA